MKILYLTYDGLTDPLGQSQILPYLSGLSALGHEITILSCEKPEAFAQRESMIRNQVAEAGINWHPSTYRKRPPIWSTFYDLLQMYRMAKKLVRAEEIDLIHCRSYLTIGIGLRLKQKLGKKVLFDMRGLWADERMDGGIWSMDNTLQTWIYYRLKAREPKLFNRSDAVVSLTHRGKAEVLSWKGVQQDPEKYEVIPCCANAQLFAPAQLNRDRLQTLRDELDVRPGEKVLGYLGSLGTWYMGEEMLRFFQMLYNEGICHKLIILTRDDPALILDVVQRLALPERAIEFKAVDRESIPDHIALFDLGLCFIKPAYSKIASSPTKLGELLCMGVPVIGNKGIGDMDELFDKEHIGVLVDDFSEEAFRKVQPEVEKLFALAAEPIREVGTKEFSLEDGIAKYDRLYRRLSDQE